MFLLALSTAHAFCGTYVGPASSSFTNGASKVILAREDSTTVLTLANDVVGTGAAFALVIPVPEVLDAGDVSLADPAIFDALDAWSTPRLVSYTCDDLYGYDSGWDEDSADTAGAGEGGDATGVTVESSFTTGDYEIVVLSATGSDGLLDWLDANGFVVSDATGPVLQEYIDQEQYFLAAKVSLDATPEESAYLEPLQFRYESAVWSLPIRIGTTASPGEQELVIFALTPAEDGLTGISNYEEVEIETDCMLPSDQDVETVYAAEAEAAFEGGIWFTEYAWNAGGCDPCASDPPAEETLTAAGGGWDGGTFVTRLHLRYTPEEATADLVLYAGGVQESSQVKYIQYAYELESDFPLCLGAATSDPVGSCVEGGAGGDTGGGETGETGGIGLEPSDDGSELSGAEGCGGGCSGTAGPAWLAGAMALGVRRRRAGRGG